MGKKRARERALARAAAELHGTGDKPKTQAIGPGDIEVYSEGPGIPITWPLDQKLEVPGLKDNPTPAPPPPLAVKAQRPMHELVQRRIALDFAAEHIKGVVDAKAAAMARDEENLAPPGEGEKEGHAYFREEGDSVKDMALGGASKILHTKLHPADGKVEPTIDMLRPEGKDHLGVNTSSPIGKKLLNATAIGNYDMPLPAPGVVDPHKFLPPPSIRAIPDDGHNPTIVGPTGLLDPVADKPVAGGDRYTPASTIMTGAARGIYPGVYNPDINATPVARDFEGPREPTGPITAAHNIEKMVRDSYAQGYESAAGGTRIIHDDETLSSVDLEGKKLIIATRIKATLYDDFMAALIDNDMLREPVDKEIRKGQYWRDTARLLRSARPFVFEREATAAALDLGLEFTELLFAETPRLRLPFPSCFIEFEQVERAFRLQQLPDYGMRDSGFPTCDRAGALLMEHQTSDGVQIEAMIVYRDARAHKIVFDPMCITLFPNGMTPRLMSASDAERAHAHLFYMFGRASPPPEAKDTVAKYARWADNHITFGMSPGGLQALYTIIGRDVPRFRKMLGRAVDLGRILNSDLSDKETERLGDYISWMENASRGTWRMIMSCLWLLNAKDRLVVEAPAKVSEERRIVHGKSRPYFAHSVIKIVLPARDEPGGHQGGPTGIHHRRHEVAAHWCVSKKKGDPNCMHDMLPTRGKSQETLACTKCGFKRWRRKAHERGDAQLGYVKQTRVVTTDKPVPQIVVDREVG